MIRRVRLTWLLDSDAPSGMAVMATRRCVATRTRFQHRIMAMRRTGFSIPSDSPFSRISFLESRGRMQFHADGIVTTSLATLAWAAESHPDLPICHFVRHFDRRLLSTERFSRYAPVIDRLILPAATPQGWSTLDIGVPPERTHLLEDFTLPQEAVPSSARNQVIVFVGRLEPGSGATQVIEAFASVRPDLPGWQLRMYGYGSQRRQSQRLIDRLGIAPYAYVMGPAYNVANLYADAGIVMRIAANDAGGLPVQEALTAGVPVIGLDSTPAVRHLLTDGYNGLVLMRSDPTEVADALVRLGHEQTRMALAAGARESECGLLRRECVTSLVDALTPA